MARHHTPENACRRRSFLAGALVVALAIVAGGATAPASAAGPAEIFGTTYRYLVVFYPRWFTDQQASNSVSNTFVGPDVMSPVFGEVVAPNDDTLYVSTFLDLADQPMILTIPETTVTYSLLTLDVYGDIFSTAIPAATAGTYALTTPDWTGRLPSGVTRIDVPCVSSEWIIRADKYSPTGGNRTEQAEVFRASLHLATLSDYESDPSAGSAVIVPVSKYATQYKVVADNLIAQDAMTFLTQLQAAVAAPGTPPMSPFEQQLSDSFNALFRGGDPPNPSAFIAGAQRAHMAIVNRYLDHLGPTNWITFANIGDWGVQYLDRAAITEFIQYGNGHDTAAYFQTFKDGAGVPLDASTVPGYVLTFPAARIPEAERFWSVTAYIPDSITLFDNDKNKYVVASYTPDLVTAPDGSITIVMAPTPPGGVPESNWLPVPDGPFNIMLRVYGPEGTVESNTYIPPPVMRVQ